MLNINLLGVPGAVGREGMAGEKGSKGESGRPGLYISFLLMIILQ